jgi:molybdopterin-biosynthesis enzyme MoeA-like protein
MTGVRILIIGNEVLSGEVEERNMGFLARRLAALGTPVLSAAVVPDDDEAISSSLHSFLIDGNRVLVTGGIGPTHDDRTRAAVAACLGIPLSPHDDAAARLRAGYGPSITPAELSMAELPEGSRLLVGQRTGVFGFAVGSVYVFPGVPELLEDIFDSVARSSPEPPTIAWWSSPAAARATSRGSWPGCRPVSPTWPSAPTLCAKRGDGASASFSRGAIRPASRAPRISSAG